MIRIQEANCLAVKCVIQCNMNMFKYVMFFFTASSPVPSVIDVIELQHSQEWAAVGRQELILCWRRCWTCRKYNNSRSKAWPCDYATNNCKFI